MKQHLPLRGTFSIRDDENSHLQERRRCMITGPRKSLSLLFPRSTPESIHARSWKLYPRLERSSRGRMYPFRCGPWRYFTGLYVWQQDIEKNVPRAGVHFFFSLCTPSTTGKVTVHEHPSRQGVALLPPFLVFELCSLGRADFSTVTLPDRENLRVAPSRLRVFVIR